MPAAFALSKRSVRTCATAFARASERLLFSVSPADVSTFATAGAVVALVGLLATYVPMRRALRVDPMTALRHD